MIEKSKFFLSKSITNSCHFCGMLCWQKNLGHMIRRKFGRVKLNNELISVITRKCSIFRGCISERSEEWALSGIFTIWCYVASKSVKLSLVVRVLDYIRDAQTARVWASAAHFSFSDFFFKKYHLLLVFHYFNNNSYSIQNMLYYFILLN